MTLQWPWRSPPSTPDEIPPRGAKLTDQQLVNAFSPILVDYIRQHEKLGNAVNGVGYFLDLARKVGMDNETRKRVLDLIESTDKSLGAHIRAYREDIVY